MKKTLAAVAVLGAFAGSAFAADVTLYGLVDEGFNYAHVDMDGFKDLKTSKVVDDKDVFQMKAGQQSTSRFGLKGVEDLGNGLKVGFVLENGFYADTGADNSAFFDRESSLFLEGGFGKVAVGRIGSFNQGQGTWSQIGRLSPFGTSFGDYSAQAGNVFSCSTRYDNTIAYQTPDFAGFKVYAMYSMGSDKYENESGSDRYYGVAATYDNGPVAAYFAVDSINYKSTGDNSQDMEDGLTVTLGGSYNFEVAKVYLGAQYFDEAKVGSIGGIVDVDIPSVKDNDDEVIWTSADNVRVTGYSVLLGADAPVAGGKLMGAVAYMDAEQSDFYKDFGAVAGVDVPNEFDFTRWVVSVGYDYPLSKRTNVYGVASYMNDKVEGKGAWTGEWNPQAYTAMIGLRHKF